MAGFPTRPTRNAFGPIRKNMGRAGLPQNTVNDAEYNRLFWQIAGAGIVCDLAAISLLTSATTGGLVLNYFQLAWDVDQLAAAPVLARTGQGIYTITFPTTTLDVDGLTVPIVFRDCEARIAGGSTTRAGWSAVGDVVASSVLQVTVTDNTDTASDIVTRVVVHGR